MFFARRDFLKKLAWLFGATQAAHVAGGEPPVTSSNRDQPIGTPSEVAMRGPVTDEIIKADFDLVVIGGGISGTTAAISAARNGVKVALVHDRAMLGGNSSSEVRLYPEGNDAHNPWIRESGIHDEFHTEDRVRNHVVYREGLMNCHWDLVLYEWVIREPNITLFLNTHMHQVKMHDAKRISAIRAIQIGTEKTYEFSAAMFLDASGDGVLGYRAGADFRWGKEGRDEYDESLAPEKANEEVMGNTLFFRSHKLDHPVPFKRPDWAAEFATEEDLTARNHSNLEAGHWWIEVGAPHHPIKDNDKILHEALRQLLGVWDHVKNKGSHGAENYAIDFVGFWPYKRESRRIIGDYVVTEKHVKSPQQLDDAVAYGCWGIDIHFPGGILNRRTRPYIPPANANFEKFGTLPYVIPLRSLYSRNIDNLLTAGRPISCSYVAFASSRVLSTGCILGQAAGVAAALCKKHNASPRTIATKHAKECQQRILRDDGHIPGVENEDPNDLARQASATASSELPLEFPQSTKSYELKFPYAQSFPVSGDRIDTISLWMASHRTNDAEVTIGLRAAPCVWDFRSEQDIATATATIKPKHSGWLDFQINAKVEPRKLYYVHLPAMEKIFWKSSVHTPGQPYPTPPGATAAQKMGATRWEPIETNRCFGVKLSPPSNPFTPDNVIRGTHRPDKWSNIWISQPQLPAHVELKWQRPQTFTTAILTFDTNPGRRENAALFRYPDCVKDYDLEAHINGEWKAIAQVRDNHVRRRTHRFDRVESDRVRLNVLATNGAPYARVYEIRIYDEA